MAKPDRDDGWFKLPCDLLAAILAAPIPKEGRIVLFEVIAQLYGMARPRTATLGPTDIARRTGLAKPNVARGIAFLLDQGMLRRVGLDAYTFVKDHDSWGSGGVPLLTPRLAAYVAHAPRLSRKRPAPHSERIRRNEVNNVIETDNGSTIASPNNAEASADALSKSRLCVIETDNAPSYLFESDKTDKIPHPQPCACETTGSESDSIPRPADADADLEPFESPASIPIRPSAAPTPAPDDGLLRRPFKPDPAELDRIVAWVVDILGPDNPAAINIGYVKAQFPLDWIEAALLEALAVPDLNPAYAWRFASRCLATWWDEGGRPRPSPRVPRPAPMSPYVPALSRTDASRQRLDAAYAELDRSQLRNL